MSDLARGRGQGVKTTKKKLDARVMSIRLRGVWPGYVRAVK